MEVKENTIMKVSMVNTEKNRGGAARMASFLAKTMNETCSDVDATLYHNQDDIIENCHHGLKFPFSNYVNAFLSRIGGSECVYDFSFSDKIISLAHDSDVLHVHNLHGYYLNWKKLLLSFQNKPILWTWHDQWGATGRCGFSMDCDNWKSGCKKCPHMDYYPNAWLDFASSEFKAKSEIYETAKNLHIVSPSQWLADIAIERGINPEQVSVIPNPVDVSSYIKYDKAAARNKLNLPVDKYIALFIAADCNDPRKGYEDFVESVKGLPLTPLVVGIEPVKRHEGFIYVGETRSQAKLSLYYSAADIMVFTSKADNYPNTIIECLICGTPVCAYSVGGVPSQLHNSLCHLVDFNDTSAIRKYLEVESAGAGKTPDISIELQNYATSMWSGDIIANKYRDLYKTIIKSNF